MKRLITTLVLAAFYSFSLTQTTYAIFCSNCSQYLTQIPQYATEIITKGATFATQINTWTSTYKITILDPIANGLITVSLLKQQSNTLNLVTGALGGGTPLLQADPEKWIKNQGLNVVQVSLSDISGQKGVYSDSLFSSVVSSFKASNNPLQTTLANLGGSSIPNTVQSNVCGDAMLTKVATNDVEQNGTTYTSDSTSQASKQAAIIKRKKEIYDSLCVGNPATNQQLASRLQQVNSQRPDIGGWDTWLSITGGDNAYNKSVQATLAISKAVSAKTVAAKDDLNRGGGIASPRQCAPGQQVQNAPNGDPVLNISDALCRGFSLTNSGSAVNAAYQTSLNSGFTRLTASFGSGILGTLSSLLSARNTINMLSNAFGTASGGSTGGTNTTVTTSATTTTQDLVGNSEGKKALVDPTMLRMDTYVTYLDQLQTQDGNLATEVSLAQSTASTTLACYQNLIKDFDVTADNPSIAAAFSYNENKTKTLDQFRAEVASDTQSIASARASISDTKTKINASNSSTEIGALYDAFEAKITNGTFPSDTLHFTRESEYQNLKGDNQVDLIDGGTVFQLNAQCVQLRQQLTPRESA